MTHAPRSLLSILASMPCLAVGAQGVNAEECTATPSYAEVVDALATLPGLDTIPLRGTISVTVLAGRLLPRAQFGEPQFDSSAERTAVCRVSILWTSRGDSLAVYWTRSPHDPRTVRGQPATAEASLADKPRPVYHTQSPAVRSLALVDSLLADAYNRHRSDAARNMSHLFVLMDTSGVLRMSRILTSSRVRALDEAALEIVTRLRFNPARDPARSVTAWFVLPISWQTYRDPDTPTMQASES